MEQMNNQHLQDVPFILLADDDPDDRDLVKKAFNKTGLPYVFDTVGDGRELVDYLADITEHSPNKRYPSLILLDLNMPRLSGLEALCMIRQHAVTQYIPVVIFSTTSSEEDIQTSYAAGCHSFIVKPLDFQGLTQVLHNVYTYWFDTVEIRVHQSETIC